MVVAPSASYSFAVRLEVRNRPGMLGRVTAVIGKTGGEIGAVDLVEMTGPRVIRDITVKARDSCHGHDILDGRKAITGVRVANISDRTFLSDEMKIAAAHAIVSCVAKAELGPEYIIPNVFNKSVARDVARGAHKPGVARRRPHSDSPAWS